MIFPRFDIKIVGWANIRHILFIRIMNNFGLLFEYSNNIQIFILLNKLPILAKISKISKISKNCVEITEHLVLGLICTEITQ
jgi:hypothetical protein